MLKFKIPFEERGIVRGSILPLRFNNIEKVWQCEDTLAGRYHAQNGLAEYCQSNTDIPQKYAAHEVVCKHSPWAHQKKAFNVLKNFDAAYLYMLPGYGKSKVIVDYHNSSDVAKTLIVCPKNVIPTWSKQFSLHGVKKGVNIVALEKGTSAKKDEQVRKAKLWPSLVVVVNYDTIWRLKEIEKIDWDLIVFDEIHRLQDSTTNVVKYCRKLKGAKKVGLTGTCGEPKKWHGQFMCLDKNLFGTSKKKYLEKFFILDYFGNPKGVRDKKISKDFGFLSHVETNTDVIDLPERSDIVKEVDLMAKKEYNNIDNEFMLEVENGLVTAANAMVKTLKLRQICSGFVQDEDKKTHDIKNGKEDTLTEMMQDMEGQNVVVFYNFKREAEILDKIAERVGRPFANISGSRRDLDAIDNPEPGTILAIQIRAGGTGIDGIQHNYRYCIFYSLSWSEIDHEQATRRVYRAGSKHKVFFYYLITQGTVEDKVLKALNNKCNVLKEVVGV